MVDNSTHETRITALEQADIDKQRRLESLERNHNDLKVTIMEENRDTRKFMQSHITQIFSADIDDKTREDKIRQERNRYVSDIIVKLVSAGGILYLVIDWITR